MRDAHEPVRSTCAAAGAAVSIRTDAAATANHPDTIRSGSPRATPLVVDRFDEHVGGPWAAVRTVAGPVAQGRIGGLHLFERHFLVDHALDPGADDRDHVAVFHQVGVIGDPAVARHEIGASGFV